MKILYAIQGTGNGHLSRAMDVVPCLANHGAVDVLLSGIQADLILPFPVQFRLNGLSFIFGKNGGVDIWETFRRSKIRRLIKEIEGLPVTDYDLVINDFEPVSAWACNFRDQPCIGLSHQLAVLDKQSPKPKEIDVLGHFILKNYAPPTTRYGFHFRAYNSRIFTPVIRQQIRQLECRDDDHYTVYLPAYDDARLLKFLSMFPDVRWEVFSKHNHNAYQLGNVSIHPIHNEKFIQSMATCTGILCGAGFETPAEALFLKKKLMVIPMTNQYEQHLNAAALAEMGVPVMRNIHPKHKEVVNNWLLDDRIVDVDYPDQTQEIIDQIIEKHK